MAHYETLPSGCHLEFDISIEARGHSPALVVRKGQILRIEDVEGQQVADVMITRLANPRDWLSCLYTKLHNGTERVSSGNILFSKMAEEMAILVADTVGVHWFGGGFCSRETNVFRFGSSGSATCRTNLAMALRGYVDSDIDLELDACVSFFMNMEVSPTGRFVLGLPTSRAGDHVDLEARDDLIVAISACPADRTPTNAYKPTPLRAVVYSAI